MIEKYLRIDPSGEIKWIELERLPRYNDIFCGASAIDIADLYPVIGCDCVEMVHSWIDGIVFFVDECGKIKDPPQALNPIASCLYAGTAYGDPIVGPVVLFSLRCTEPYGEHDIFPLTDSQLSVLSLALGVQLPAL